MFGLFGKRSPKDKLMKRYNTLIKEAHRLSHVNRTLSDQKMAEAEAVMNEVMALDNAR
ncbi:MAG: Lacal_2735 family protein [Bacteroidota bacterium]